MCDDGASGPILFGQKRIAPTFARIGSKASDNIRGRSLVDVAADLRSGKLSPDELPIEYFVHEGKRITINNRGLAALRMAGLEPTITRRVKPTQDQTNRLKEKSINRHHMIPGRRIAVTENKDGTNHLYSVFF
jgi:cbb3-type cytochrome oxidase cytochrome c subunit